MRRGARDIIIPAAAAGTAATAGDGYNIIAAGTQTANTTGTVLFQNSNGVTFGMSNNSVVTATVKTDYQSSNANYLTSQSNQAVSANGSFTFQTLSFSNANGFSFGTSAGPVITGSYTVPTQTNQTVGLYAVGNTTGQSSSTTVDARSISFDAAGIASVGYSGGSVVISVPSGGGAGDGVNIIAAGTQTANTTGTVLFQNSNGISFGMSNNSVVTASYTVPTQTNQSAIKGLGVSNTGNTAGNTGLSTGIDWVIAGSNGITASESTAVGGPNTIWISGVTTAAQTNQSAIKGLGASNTGNTAGNTGLSTGIDWVIAGSQNITVSESTAAGGPNTLWISGPVADSQGMSNIGNTSGTTGLVSQRYVFAGGNFVTLSQSVNGGSGTLTISANMPYNRVFQPFPQNMTVAGQWGDGFGKMQPFYAHEPVTATQINQYVIMSMSTSSNSSWAGTMSFSVGIYSLNASSWSLASSGSQSYAFTNTSNNSTSVLSGMRRITVPINVNMTPGAWAILVYSHTSTTNANWFTASNFIASANANTYAGLWGAASSASNQMFPGAGFMNQAASFVTAMPSSVHSSNISGGALAQGWQPFVDFQIDAY